MKDPQIPTERYNATSQLYGFKKADKILGKA